SITDDGSNTNYKFFLIYLLCGKLGNFLNNYYQCEICINAFGLGSKVLTEEYSNSTCKKNKQLLFLKKEIK
ncbi:24647_t:CDS:2, partial [Gigaspora margarita]